MNDQQTTSQLRPSASYSAEHLHEAIVKIEIASRLIREAAKAVDHAGILCGHAKALRGVDHGLRVFHRRINDYWCRWRDTAAERMAAPKQGRAGQPGAMRSGGEE